MPTNEQGIKVLGTPLSHDSVAHHLREVAREQQGLLDKIKLVRDFQKKNTPGHTMKGDHAPLAD